MNTASIIFLEWARFFSKLTSQKPVGLARWYLKRSKASNTARKVVIYKRLPEGIWVWADRSVSCRGRREEIGEWARKGGYRFHRLDRRRRAGGGAYSERGGAGQYRANPRDRWWLALPSGGTLSVHCTCSPCDHIHSLASTDVRTLDGGDRSESVG